MAAYKVQNGPIKDSTFKLTYMMHKASQNQIDGSVNELRLVSNPRRSATRPTGATTGSPA